MASNSRGALLEDWTPGNEPPRPDELEIMYLRLQETLPPRQIPRPANVRVAIPFRSAGLAVLRRGVLRAIACELAGIVALAFGSAGFPAFAGVGLSFLFFGMAVLLGHIYLYGQLGRHNLLSARYAVLGTFAFGGLKLVALVATIERLIQG